MTTANSWAWGRDPVPQSESKLKHHSQKQSVICNLILIKSQAWRKFKDLWPHPLSYPGPHLIFRYTKLFSSVKFSCSVVANSLRPLGLQHSRLPWPSPTPGVYSDSCPLSWWCHPTISSSVVPISCLQSFPVSGSFQMSQLFASGGQSIGVSASTSVLPMNIQDWSPLGWTGWIAL